MLDKNQKEVLIYQILGAIGEEPEREGVLRTPHRVVKMWDEIFAGYNQNPEDVLTVFDAEGYDQIILLKDIEMYSMCLSGSTLIETPNGRIPIKYLKDGDWVYSYDEKDYKIVLNRCVLPKITGKARNLIRVNTDKDTLLCTSEHRILTIEGWKEAINLKTGDSIISMQRGSIFENGKLRPYISYTGNKKQFSESRFIAESIHGKLSKGMHVHHIDENTANNNPSNLCVLPMDEHFRWHRKNEDATGFALFTQEQRDAMREKQIEGIRRSQTKETRQKRAVSVKDYWDSLSKEQRKIRNHKVISIEETDWFEDVWNMEIPKFHNFIANGMVVHNCEHHMLPFIGKAHIAYIPDKKIIGISKLARLLDIYARRLQIQERIGRQVTSDLMNYLQPKGAACIIEAQHLCMKMRGVNKQNLTMVTSSLTGVFRTNASSRNELIQLLRK